MHQAKATLACVKVVATPPPCLITIASCYGTAGRRSNFREQSPQLKRPALLEVCSKPYNLRAEHVRIAISVQSFTRRHTTPHGAVRPRKSFPCREALFSVTIRAPKLREDFQLAKLHR